MVFGDLAGHNATGTKFVPLAHIEKEDASNVRAVWVRTKRRDGNMGKIRISDSYLLVSAKVPNTICHADDPGKSDGRISFPVGRSSPPAT